MKERKANNRVYIWIIIFLVIIILHLHGLETAAEYNLENAESINSYNVKQLDMIDYVGSHIQGISDYSNLILENNDLLRDGKLLNDNGLELFSSLENECSIAALDDFTVYYEYMCDYDNNRRYSFYYVSAVNDENIKYIDNCISINANIFVKPHEMFLVEVSACEY